MQTTEKGFNPENLNGCVYHDFTSDREYGIAAHVQDGKMWLDITECGNPPEKIDVESVEEMRERIVQTTLDFYDNYGVEADQVQADRLGIVAELNRDRSGNGRLCAPRQEPLVVSFLAHGLDGRHVIQVTEYHPRLKRPHSSNDITHDVHAFTDGKCWSAGCMFDPTKVQDLSARIPLPAQKLLEGKHQGGIEYVVLKDTMGMEAIAQQHEADFVAEHGSNYRPQPKVDSYLLSESTEASEGVKL